MVRGEIQQSGVSFDVEALLQPRLLSAVNSGWGTEKERREKEIDNIGGGFEG